MNMDEENAEAKQLNTAKRKLYTAALMFVLYVSDMATDIAASIQLYQAGPSALWGGCLSTIFIIFPIIIYIIHEVIYQKQNKCSQKVRNIMVDLLFSPIVAVLCYGKKIFWLIEAVFIERGPEMLAAERRADKPHRIEFYLLLRPFLQAVPQSFLQMFLLIYIADVDIREVQAMSMFTSIVVASIMATNFQRFESQEKKTTANSSTQDKSDNEFNTTACMLQTKSIKNSVITNSNETKVISGDPNKESLKVVASEIHSNPENDDKSSQIFMHQNNINSSALAVADDPQSDVNTDESDTSYSDDFAHQINESRIESLPPPIPPRHSRILTPARPPSRHIQRAESDKSHPCSDTNSRLSRVSFLRHSYAESAQQSSLPKDSRRSSYQYLPVSATGSSNCSFEIKILAVPDFQAPAIPIVNSAPSVPTSPTPTKVPLPIRIRGTKYVKEEVTIAYIISLLKWILFIASRLIALCGLLAFFYDSLTVMLIALGCVLLHWIIMNVVISVNCDPKMKSRWKILFLSFSSLYCLIEVGTKFKKFTRIIAIYWPLCLLENIVASFVAYQPHHIEPITNWWNAYLFYTMCSTYLLSTACFLFNTYIIIPETYIVYNDEDIEAGCIAISKNHFP